ncbi:MAG TPA: zf-HC2 domain-containing protein, partial [Candidatus Polarisedimenticolia bacterium]|nr:zf-HC2 domain-containing protein [Candidatus Polarisedimenticolia bacterium]
MRAGERPNHPIELMSASIDGELKPAEAAALEAHLEGCAECRTLLADFRRLDGPISEEVPPAVPADLRGRILARLASRTAAPPVPFWKQAMPLAAAASIVVALLLWYARPDRLPPLRATEPGPVPSMAAPAEGEQALASPEADRLLKEAPPPPPASSPVPAPAPQKTS